jgi:hypothetical protein
MGRPYSPAILAGEQQPGHPGRKTVPTMFMALPIITLLALVLLGGLAAAVFGVVYAIVNKRPGVALGSVVAPIAAFFALALMAVLYLRSHTVPHIAESEPAQVHWAAQPSMPAMPPMPAMADGPNPLAVDADISFAAILLFVLLAGTLYFAFSGKRRSGDGPKRFSWGRAIVGIVLAILVLNVFAFSTVTILPEERVAWEPADAVSTVDEHARFARDQAQLQITEARRMADEAAEKAAAARNDGKNFQEMLEKLNKPRIKLDKTANVTKLSVETKTSPAAEISTADGETKFLVPISDETQQSLARSAAHLEQMVERVSQMADQVSDAGTLVGRAMVALNEQIDSRRKSESVEVIAEKIEPTAPSQDQKQFADVNVMTVSTGEQIAATDDIEIESPSVTSIEIKFDRAKLDRIGLSFEKLKQILGRDGLWHGAVVRFDPKNWQITVTGQFDDRYLSNLKNTLVHTEGWRRKPVHLKDVAAVKVPGNLLQQRLNVAGPPAWIHSPSKRVGNTRREVVESGEYSTVDECYKAADIYLLLATYNHLIQLTGDTARVSDSSRPALTFDDVSVWADGKIIMANGFLQDDRLQRLSRVGVGVDFIRREIAKEEYVATTERSFGPMKNLYTLVEFTPSVDADLIRRWNDNQREQRFAVVGVGAGSVLGAIGMLFGLLKVDTWTKGYYTKRLFLGVPAAIIGVLALLGLAAG